MFYLIVAYGLLKAPIIGKYVSIINTLFHEVGHAIASFSTGGKVEKIELLASAEGTAWSSSRFWIGRVFTSLAGYVASSLTALLFLSFIYTENYFLLLATLIFIVAFSFVFWIRNLYGFIWVITATFISWSLLKLNNTFLTENFLLLITAIIFIESIRSSFVIMKLSFTQPKDAGDATSLWRSILIIPPQIWGMFFFLQSLAFGAIGILLFLDNESVVEIVNTVTNILTYQF